MNQDKKNKIKELFDSFKAFRSSDRGQLIICFFLAFFVWIPVKLEKTYTAQGQLDINFIAPKDYVLSDNKLLDVSVNYLGSGFDILKFKLLQKGVIDIVLPDRQGDFVFRNDQLNALLREQSNAKVDIVANTLDEIRLYSDLQAEKKVPVKNNLNLSAAPGYMVHREMVIQPDSVLIKGPKKIVDTIAYVMTIDRHFSDLTQSMLQKTQLIVPNGTSVHPDKVEFKVKVEQMTEKTIDVSLNTQLPQLHDDSILIIPSEASIALSLPISMYDSFSADQLLYNWSFDTTKLDQPEGFIGINIESPIAAIRVLSYHPDSVRILRVLEEKPSSFD